MNDAAFDRLPPKLQLAFGLGTLARMLGRETVERHYRMIRPVVDDAFAHGAARAATPPGDAEDPSQNYWGGVWQIHRAD